MNSSSERSSDSMFGQIHLRHFGAVLAATVVFGGIPGYIHNAETTPSYDKGVKIEVGSSVLSWLAVPDSEVDHLLAPLF